MYRSNLVNFLSSSHLTWNINIMKQNFYIFFFITLELHVMINIYIYIYIIFFFLFLFPFQNQIIKRKKKRAFFSFLFSFPSYLVFTSINAWNIYFFFSFPYHILPLNILFSLSVVVTNHNVKIKRKLKKKNCLFPCHLVCHFLLLWQNFTFFHFSFL